MSSVFGHGDPLWRHYRFHIGSTAGIRIESEVKHPEPDKGSTSESLLTKASADVG